MLGLVYVRVLSPQARLPFKLQIYFNGHHWLSSELNRKGIAFQMLDNAFVHIADWNKAQQLSDSLDIKKLHKKLNEFAQKYCPVHREFKQEYHWSIISPKAREYATDIVFHKQQELQPIYAELITCAIHAVKTKNIVTFLAKKFSPLYEGEIGNQYPVRLEGSCIKHTMGKASIKMYDKFRQSRLRRDETTGNDVAFFKHYREAIHRDGTSTKKEAAMKKNIYSLKPLKDILASSNHRYLVSPQARLSAIDDHSLGHKKLEKVAGNKVVENRNYKGFNFFSKLDKLLMLLLGSGEFNIYGFRAKDIRAGSNYTQS